MTPVRSRAHLAEAYEILGNMGASDVERAAALAVQLCDGVARLNIPICGLANDWLAGHFGAHQIGCGWWRCGIILLLSTLDRLARRSLVSNPDALLYCDPPYPGTSNKYAGTFTVEDADVLQRQVLVLAERGWGVAVSATYPEGSPELEDRFTVLRFDAPRMMGSDHEGKRRTEVLAHLVGTGA